MKNKRQDFTSTWQGGVKCPARMVAGFKTACHRKVESIQWALNQPPWYLQGRKRPSALPEKMDELQNLSWKTEGLRNMSAPRRGLGAGGDSAYVGKVEM